jgi:hypothetical protein
LSLLRKFARIPRYVAREPVRRETLLRDGAMKFAGSAHLHTKL